LVLGATKAHLMTNTAVTASKLPSLLLFTSSVALVAAFGAQFEPGAWYSQLQKPDWNPPNWVFGPVWTLLYIGIAAAGWLVWRETGRVQPALQLWGLQLIANGMWSWLFFGLHQPGIALVDIAVLFCLIVSFIIVSRRYSVAASWLFVPYAIWVGFAAALNASIWSAN
jgi:benzodiazapine receptor